MTILDNIVAVTLRELKTRKKKLPLAELRSRVAEAAPPLDFAAALRGDRVRIIAEVKRASPSKGLLREDFDPVAIAQEYARSGAAAISVLTEPHYFQGSLSHLQAIRKSLGNQLPLLRKDFIVDPYQVYESRAAGVDAFLLIVSVLDYPQLTELLALGNALGMGCLVEVHNEVEVEVALRSKTRIIGINNRDLATFSVDLTNTQRLRPLIPPDRIVVSESGIRNRADIAKLREWQVDAALVGEALMASPDIAASLKELQ